MLLKHSDVFPDLAGTVVDHRYLLIGVIGSGSYGKCYKSLDIKSPSSKPLHYAVKCLPRAARGSDDEAFQAREFAIHKRLTKAAVPNIVAFHRVIFTEHYAYIILELCDGGDLFAAITEHRLFSGNDQLIKMTFLQIVNAVNACHQRGVYHRDLKPENILRRKDGIVKLADFGLATEASTSREFKTGSSFYLSPECIYEEIKDECYSTSHNDIWALGIILVNLITHRHPWRKAVTTDECFASFLHDRDFFRRTCHISAAANTLLRQIFQVNSLSRISLSELLSQTLAVETFFRNRNDPPLASLVPRIGVPSLSFSAYLPHIMVNSPTEEVARSHSSISVESEEDRFLFPSPAAGLEPMAPEHAPHLTCSPGRVDEWLSNSSSFSGQSSNGPVTPPATDLDFLFPEFGSAQHSSQKLRPQIISFYQHSSDRHSSLRARFVKRDRRVSC